MEKKIITNYLLRKDITYCLGIKHLGMKQLISQDLVQISMGKNFLTTKSCFKKSSREWLFITSSDLIFYRHYQHSRFPNTEISLAASGKTPNNSNLDPGSSSYFHRPNK